MKKNKRLTVLEEISLNIFHSIFLARGIGNVEHLGDGSENEADQICLTVSKVSINSLLRMT